MHASPACTHWHWQEMWLMTFLTHQANIMRLRPSQIGPSSRTIQHTYGCHSTATGDLPQSSVMASCLPWFEPYWECGEHGGLPLVAWLHITWPGELQGSTCVGLAVSDIWQQIQAEVVQVYEAKAASVHQHMGKGCGMNVEWMNHSMHICCACKGYMACLIYCLYVHMMGTLVWHIVFCHLHSSTLYLFTSMTMELQPAIQPMKWQHYVMQRNA